MPPVCKNDDYAVTGHVRASSFSDYISVLTDDMPVAQQLTSDSVFMDVGSGMGRPPLSVAASTCCRSIGIELQPLATAQSLTALERTSVSMFGTMGRTYLSNGDIADIVSIEGITHLYAFNVGMPPAVIGRIAALAAWADSVQVLTLYDGGKPKALVDVGVLDATTGGAGIVKRSMTMPSGHRYTCWIVPMVPERRARMRDVLQNPGVDGFCATMAHALYVVSNEEAYAEYLQQLPRIREQLATTTPRARSGKDVGASHRPVLGHGAKRPKRSKRSTPRDRRLVLEACGWAVHDRGDSHYRFTAPDGSSTFTNLKDAEVCHVLTQDVDA